MNNRIIWKKDIAPYLNERILNQICSLPETFLFSLTEIRISSKGIVSLSSRNKNIILKDNEKNNFFVSMKEIEDIFLKVCSKTVYRFENQIKNGYITIPGGHRVGFCGTAVYQKSELVTVKNITSVCFRISRQIKNAAREIIGNILSGDKINSALIVSEPCGGKTTILSDLSRLLSEKGIRCAVIDERGEICSVFEGSAQKDVGDLTFIYDGYCKSEGMMLALRTMAPQVIICDEIGNGNEVLAMLEAMNAGVPVIATAHAGDEDELLDRPQIEQLVDSGAIDKLIFLKGAKAPCSVKKVITVNRYDEDSWNSNNCD